MALILFDTNVFIDMLNGVHAATVELNYYDDPAISVITYMELCSGTVQHPQDKPILDAVLAEFSVIQLEPEIIAHAINIRGRALTFPPKIKLPDAIIAATALSYGIPLVTRNKKDFSNVSITIHTPYHYDLAKGEISNVKHL